MENVLKTYYLNTYLDAQGVPEWENDMTYEIDSLKKNQTWELVS